MGDIFGAAGGLAGGVKNTSDLIFKGFYSGPLKFRQYEAAIDRMGHDIQEGQWKKDFLSSTEDPRNRAQQMQTMWGRGLGKSTIADQEMSRMKAMQDERQIELQNSLSDLSRRKSLLKQQLDAERSQFYADIGIGILGLALSVFSFGVGAPAVLTGAAGMIGGMAGSGAGTPGYPQGNPDINYSDEGSWSNMQGGGGLDYGGFNSFYTGSNLGNIYGDPGYHQ